MMPSDVDLGPRCLANLRTFLAGLVVLPTTCAGSSAGANGRRTPSSAPTRRIDDTCIAACRLIRELPFARFNAKDFAERERLEILPTQQAVYPGHIPTVRGLACLLAAQPSSPTCSFWPSESWPCLARCG